MFEARVSNKSGLQEGFRVFKVFRVLRQSRLSEFATGVSSKSVRQECLTGKSVSQECPIKVSYKSAPQEYATRVSQKSVPHHTIVREEYQARMFCKSGF